MQEIKIYIEKEKEEENFGTLASTDNGRQREGCSLSLLEQGKPWPRLGTPGWVGEPCD